MHKQFLFWFALCFIFAGCDNRTEYLKHEIELEKLGPCKEHSAAINVEANTIGERFVFEHCLNEEKSSQSSVVRSNDTVFVKFDGKENPNTLYKVILDVNTMPEYNFLSIDGNVFSINVKR